MLKQNLNHTSHKGITLIALIITIIVMLILVAVTISMAINGGLFKKTGEAVGETQNAINREQQLGMGSIIDKYVYNISEKVANLPEYSEELLDETTKVLTKNAKFISGNQVAVIPKGFKVIEGINGSKSIADGLVITDEIDSQGNSIGNEFVWIPVTIKGTTQEEKEASFETIRKDGYQNGKLQKLVSEVKVTEPFTKGYSDGNGTEEIKEYNEMRTSIIENGGFYIGRYEAGSQDENGNPIARTDTANGTSKKVVVKRDQYPYIYVGWGPTTSDYTENVTDQNGKDQGQGALYLSKHMYDDQDIGAISTLCYGIQWDAMLDFIKDEKDIVDSTSWGNYQNNSWKIARTKAKYTTDPSVDAEWTPIPEEGKEKTSSNRILLTTGADDSFSAKNIYDIGGNVAERTNEINSTISMVRATRGGYYADKGSGYPASWRFVLILERYCDYANGFRPTLYIKVQ